MPAANAHAAVCAGWCRRRRIGLRSDGQTRDRQAHTNRQASGTGEWVCTATTHFTPHTQHSKCPPKTNARATHQHHDLRCAEGALARRLERSGGAGSHNMCAR
jgi:hypothetical protein